MPKNLNPENSSPDSFREVVKEASLPCFLLIIVKFLGMLILPYLLNFPYAIKWQLEVFPINFVFTSEAHAQIVNSYTNLAMYTVIFLGFLWVLIRSYHFHDTHVKPSTTIKLAELKMLHLISSSFEVYHSAFVWFCFMWLSVIVVSVYYLLALSFQWVFIITFLTSVMMTYLLIDDLEKEFYIWRLFNEKR